MQAQREAVEGGQTLGQRAAIELRLSDARRDLQEAIEQRNVYSREADVQRALAAEVLGQARVTRNAQAIKYRLRAAGMDGEIAEFRGRVTMLEGMLSGSPAQAVPVVLPADAVAGMDDTLCGVAA